MTSNNSAIFNTAENEMSMNPELVRIRYHSPVRPVIKRWNPIKEQLFILEDMYGRGIRAPDVQEIQQITELLAFYGKVEGHNVFYWFQNRKARDRQKLRCMKESKQEPKSTIFAEDPELDLSKGWNSINELTDECFDTVEGYDEGKDRRPKRGSTGALKTLELFPTCSGL